MTADRVWELLNMDKWTITYAADDVREVDAKLKFKTPGTEVPYHGSVLEEITQGVG